MTNVYNTLIINTMKIKGPLLSINAHGTIANTLTFSKRKTHQHLRSKQKQNKKITPKQQEWRLLMDFVSLKWASLNDDEKAAYTVQAQTSQRNITGFQMFASYAMKDPKEYLDFIFFCPFVYEAPANEFINYADQTYNILSTNPTLGRYEIITRNTRKTKYTNRSIEDRNYFTTPKTKPIGISNSEFTVIFLYRLIKYVSVVRPFGFSESANYDSGFFMYQDEIDRIKIILPHPDGDIYPKAYDNYTIGEEVLMSYTLKDGDFKVYVNGNLETESINVVPNVAVSNKVAIHDWVAASTGNVSEMSYVTILNRELSASEIKTIYKSLKINQGDK